jgi:hypothetical protein
MKILLISILILPYIIGLLQYNNAKMVIENLTDKTDGEIVSVLYTFDFKLDVFDTPTFTDYYKSGLLTIIHL